MKTRVPSNSSRFPVPVQNLVVFTLSEPVPTKRERTGTEVKISEIQRNFPSLEGPNAVQEMSGQLALYLRKYPAVQVSYNGTSGGSQVPSRTLLLITRLAKSAWTMIGS